MGRTIAIKSAIILVVALVVYSVFWFFKVGQVEKQVNKFISENGANISVGEVSVSGFPLSQKITLKDLKFTIPHALFNKRQVIVKHLEASAGIFSSEFSVALIEPVAVQDADNNIANVEFSQAPTITIAITDGRISKFTYQDLGYRILESSDRSVIYAASNSMINLESSIGDGERIVTKISTNIKDIEGFDIMNVYKNAFEKKIMDGIKTGEIAIGNAASALIPTQIVSAADSAAPAATSAPQSAIVPAPAAIATPAPTPVDPNAPVAEQQKPTEIAAVAVADTSLVKSNFSFDIEYSLIPLSQGTEQAQIPLDPTQIQEMPTQYSKVIKVNSLEFSNPLYKISINGEMNMFADDDTASGAVAIKIEKIDSLIGYITTAFAQMADQKNSVSGVQSSDLANSGLSAEDSYQSFLKRVAVNLGPVAKELAAKNAVSKEDIAEFDVRREKNLDFLINETSVREILGKF